MSYINHSQEIERLEGEIDKLREKYAKMGIFTYISADDPYKPNQLLLSIKINDIGKFVIERVAGNVKDKIGISSKVITHDNLTYLSIILDLRNASQDEVKRAIDNAVKLLQEYADTGIGATIVPDSEKNINKLALLINMNDYAQYVVKTALSRVKTNLPVSTSIKTIDVEGLSGSYITIVFGNRRNGVII